MRVLAAVVGVAGLATGLSAGEHALRVWHESLGRASFEVERRDGAAASEHVTLQP